MFYLVYGPQAAKIRTRENKIISEVLGKKDEFNFIRFDAEATPIGEIMDECDYMPLGCDKKIVSVTNCYFFTKPLKTLRNEKDQDWDKLLEYIDRPSEGCDIIFSLVTSKLDEKNDIYQLLFKKGEDQFKKIEQTDLTRDGFIDYAIHLFNDRLNTSITSEAAKELVARSGNDLDMLFNNAVKLSAYTDHVTYSDVCLLVTRPLEENSFQIFNYLLKGKIDSAISVYRDLKVTSVEPVTLVSLLAGQFRTLNEVSYLVKRKMSDDEIARELGINPVRAKILRDNTRSIASYRINSVLDELYNLDVQIKSGQVDRYYAFELFLTRFKAY
ncbi:MAG: DNA polymerase III subunit delta [Coprobacillus sp.]|nr:DNA polymerase III subunit delta [Coprobacillus sp.]